MFKWHSTLVFLWMALRGIIPALQDCLNNKKKHWSQKVSWIFHRLLSGYLCCHCQVTNDPPKGLQANIKWGFTEITSSCFEGLISLHTKRTWSLVLCFLECFTFICGCIVVWSLCVLCWKKKHLLWVHWQWQRMCSAQPALICITGR